MRINFKLKRCQNDVEACILTILFCSQLHLSPVVKKPVLGVLTRSHTNQSVQPQKMVRGLKFGSRGIVQSKSQKNGAGHLCSFRAADLGLFFVFAIAKSRFSHDKAYLCLKTVTCLHVLLFLPAYNIQ